MISKMVLPSVCKPCHLWNPGFNTHGTKPNFMAIWVMSSNSAQNFCVSTEKNIIFIAFHVTSKYGSKLIEGHMMWPSMTFDPDYALAWNLGPPLSRESTVIGLWMINLWCVLIVSFDVLWCVRNIWYYSVEVEDSIVSSGLFRQINPRYMELFLKKKNQCNGLVLLLLLVVIVVVVVVVVVVILVIVVVYDII